MYGGSLACGWHGNVRPSVCCCDVVARFVCLFLQFVIAQDFHRRGPRGGPRAPAPGQEGEVTGVWRAMRVDTTQVSADTRFFSDKHDVSLFLNSYLCPLNQFWIFGSYNVLTITEWYLIRFFFVSHLYLTLCVPCIILQCVNNQRDAQFL